MGLYGLPFDGIKGIRSEMVRLKAEEGLLLSEADALQKEVTSLLGWKKPISLLRVFNNAYAPMVWRDMTLGRNKKLTMSRGLSSELGRQVLASLAEDERKKLLDIEFKRVHLSYALGLLQYEIARLKRLEADFEVLRRMMREMNQH